MFSVKFKDSPFKIMTFLYLFFIFLFTFLYDLSISKTTHFSLVDAFFLSSSAISGSGLSTINTSSDLTFLGQFFLLSEIQIGGIGIMTAFGIFLLLFRKNLSMNEQTLMSFDQNQKSLKSIRKLILFIFSYSLLIELVGAFFIYPTMHTTFSSIHKALFVSIFHSISSFTNAGFDLFGDSLLGFSKNPYFLLSTACLIFLGTIGFPVLYELMFNWKQKRSLYTKITLLTHFILLFVGFSLLLVFEWNHALRNFTFFDKLSNALFLSVSARNAGFASFDNSFLTGSSLLMVSFLMFIGGSPSSAGGGIRTTTFAVLFAKMITILKGGKEVILFKKSLHDEDVNKAIVVTFLFFSIFFCSTLTIMFVEQKPFEAISYEVMSALSTTGLSVGITSTLSDFSKIWLSIVMIVARIGVLSLIYGFMKPKKTAIRYKKENILIG